MKTINEMTCTTAQTRGFITFGIPLDRLEAICNAERDGRCVVLPCKVDATVYTIKENYFDCENCEHKSRAQFNREINRVCCDLEHEHCPYSIDEHIVGGFDVFGENGEAGLSLPGEWGCEGLEHFIGVDGKCHFTPAEAEAALAAKEGEVRDE